MPKEPKFYRRLPGRGFEHAIPRPYVYLVAFLVPIVLFIGRLFTLWQGPDHLLQVSSTGYSELYKRFYFRDIQAITIRKTAWSNVWTVIFAILILGFFLVGLELGSIGRTVVWSNAVFFLTCMLVHLMLGPSCVCHVRTAVQTEKLPTLRRVKAARKTIQRIRPLITEAQGQLSAAELAQRTQPAMASGFEPVSSGGMEKIIDAPPVIAPEARPPEASA